MPSESARPPFGEHLLGIDLGGTKTALVAGVLPEPGRPLRLQAAIKARREFASRPEEGFDRWLKRLQQDYQDLQDTAPGWSPVAAGISCGGPAQWSEGILLDPPNLPGWEEAPLVSAVSEATGLHCRMEHDGRAGAAAEFWYGGHDVRDLIFLTFGTGIGAGIISGGRLLRGVSGAAGEIGHVRIHETGPLAYGKQGSLEGYASGIGISKLAAMAQPSGGPPPSAAEVIRAAAAGDEIAAGVLQDSARGLGRGLAILADLFNPQLILLGTLAQHLPPGYLQTALEEMHREALPENVRVCTVRPARLGNRLQDVAALAAACTQAL